MNYTDFANRIADLTGIPEADPAGNFNAMLPPAIDYAEQRIYRELNLAYTSVRSSAYQATANTRVLALPSKPFITITGINVIAPATAPNPDAGTRTPLTAVSWEYLDDVYGSASTVGLPRYFALQDPATIAFGPWPDASYPLEILATVRPPALSSANASTILTQYLPDLFVSAAMVFLSGRMRNYGAQSDDPQQGVTWESQYQKQLASAAAEEARKKFGAT